ncbi:MAG TPA: amino-acid racemase [Clostridia bacterium]|nr:amino-acid racemase [Clostridia bacterium]
MKNILDLPTPSFLVDLDKLESNIKEMAEMCKKNGKQLWPMVKTHKSTFIAEIQQNHGAKGFLVGTIDEAEKLVEKGFKEIMVAYPVASKENIERIIKLAKNSHIILSFDGIEAATKVEEACEKVDTYFDYLIIIDSGLHRFGVAPEKAIELAEKLKKLTYLKLKGIATHPGHAYSKTNIEEIKKVAREEIESLTKAATLLKKEGYPVEIVATGSTPTASFVVGDKIIDILRPGNYVFYDAIQVALGVTTLEKCALTVLATVISHPKEDLFIINVGSKGLGLDKGAHGSSLIQSYGIVKGHPELIIESLSEEVGKVKVTGNTDIKVSGKIEIIPNHACSTANMTSYLIGHRNGIIEKVIPVDAREGTQNPLALL